MKQKSKAKTEFEEYEKALYDMGFSCICGVDEVGRGPWAGPITACAVIFSSYFSIFKEYGIMDSKKLNEVKREEIFEKLTSDNDFVYNVASISAKEIDEIGLGRANHLVLKRAVEGLPSVPDYILVDGFVIKDINMRQERVIKGDGKVLSIAAASIIAKVTRDRYMIKLAKKYPHYGFDGHKGYGTAKHQEAIKQHGLCPEHRKSFKPIAKILNNK